MKLNALFAAALVATSSAAFAGVNNGSDISNISATYQGGEMILAAWDDAQQKSILFDTGVTFKQLIDAKDSDTPITVNLNAIDPTYKSFFNNDVSHLLWNAYVGSNANSGAKTNSSKYFGYMLTAQDPSFWLANVPTGIAAERSVLSNRGSEVSNFSENFANNGVIDTTPDSVNISYRVDSVANQAYLGDKGDFWGTPMGNISGNSPTAVNAGEFSTLVFFGMTNFTTAAGPNKGKAFDMVFARAKFDAEAGTFRINTPVPAAAWLLMSGIAGFGAIARRRKQQA